MTPALFAEWARAVAVTAMWLALSASVVGLALLVVVSCARGILERRRPAAPPVILGRPFTRLDS